MGRMKTGASKAKRLRINRKKFVPKGRSNNNHNSKENRRPNEQVSLPNDQLILRQVISDELDNYKKQLCDYILTPKFQNGFINVKQWKKCVSHCVRILNNISVDNLIEMYCTSDENSIAYVKKQFRSSDTKNGLRDQYLNGYEWPKYAPNYGSKVRSKGNFDIHHIIPKSWGGGNTADNVIPMHADDHYDHQGVHDCWAPLSALRKNLNKYKDKYYGKS